MEYELSASCKLNPNFGLPGKKRQLSCALVKFSQLWVICHHFHEQKRRIVVFLQVNPKLHQRQSFKVMPLLCFSWSRDRPEFQGGNLFFFSLLLWLFDILRIIATERMSCGDPRGRWQGCYKVKSAAAAEKAMWSLHTKEKDQQWGAHHLVSNDDPCRGWQVFR